MEALLATSVATESTDTFAFKWQQVEPPTAVDRITESISLNFAKIEFVDGESDSRKEALLAAAEPEAVLEEQLGTDLNVRVTGGGEAGMIIKLDDVLITSISTGGSDGEDRFLTDLADYDLLG
jgi:type VI protein secretion system component Hcp